MFVCFEVKSLTCDYNALITVLFLSFQMLGVCLTEWFLFRQSFFFIVKNTTYFSVYNVGSSCRVYLALFKHIYIFLNLLVWLHQVLVMSHKIFDLL